MEISVKAIKFDVTEKLQDFVQKKVARLERQCADIQRVEVVLKVVKPATALNKEAGITVLLPGDKIFVEKTCDTFEEAVDLGLDAVKKQLERYKEKQERK